MQSTIVALATPTGRSGIGVIRLSGIDALGIAAKLLDDLKFSPPPRLASLRHILDPATHEVLDEAIVTYFEAPHSFTGEDVVEISCHGSPILLRRVIDCCLALDARLAEPGEFSLRALSNGRMDLAEAEAIRDLIDSQTLASARQAMRQLRGEFSSELQPIKDELLDVIIILESALEFVEDDLPEIQAEKVREKLGSISREIERMAATFAAGKLIRDGLRVAIVGRPNVGKSSLFNALLGSERAIVTEIAGTTRDQIHERFVVENIPISLIDTAGLRETADVVESIGVERSRRTMTDADVVILMLDASAELTGGDRELLTDASPVPRIIALNKIDAADDWAIVEFEHAVRDVRTGPTDSIINISAKTGEGLLALQTSIVRPFEPSDVSDSGFLVTDARHHDLLVRANAEIDQSLSSLDQHLSEEIVLIGLHNALRYLGQITGETTNEDLLTRIFSTFCIGK